MAPDRGVRARGGQARRGPQQRKILSVRGKPAMKKKAGGDQKQKKAASLKKQIRSIERLLKRDLPSELRGAQEKRLKELKEQDATRARLELERKMSVRYKKVKFFERRKVERRIRRAEKEMRNAPDNQSKQQAAEQLAQLKEDLEYVRFFPKAEKYISLFVKSNDDQALARRQKIREMIKSNLAAAAAAGIELEETGSEEDFAADMSEDEFFLKDTSDAEADDEWTDRNLNDCNLIDNVLKKSRPMQVKKPNITTPQSQKQKSKKSAGPEHPQSNKQRNPGSDVVGKARLSESPEISDGAELKEKRKRKRKRPSKKK